ncbi:FAD-dependent oxidoreductase [Candidatus Saccharibacteria bacterium]|nr:FAD-dependent oxidoreductase [Candidatus Saccharibacteria bacterium]
MYDIIIIGAGVAGMTAAIYARRAGKTVLLLEKKASGGQIVSALEITNWPGEISISGAELTDKIYHQVNNLGAKFDYADIDKIEKDGEIWKIWSSEEPDNCYRSKTVILAMGTEPRKLSEKQAADAGERPISYCATCDGALYKGKPVVVVGSGNTAKHEMKYLENICSKVYHIHHDDPIPKDAEAVFVAIGRVPNTGFVQNVVELDKSGFVVAGEDCKTSTPGIFAAGDCRTKDVRQLVTAAADGAVAAMEANKLLQR